MILHIIENEEWQKGIDQGEYTPSTLITEGFIHCATTDQVIEIANLFFSGATDLKILCIDPKKVNSKIIYEDTENFGKLFPHIYGPLNLNSVFKIVNFIPEADGSYKLPSELKELN